jgi:hypothetical protein
MTHRLFLDAAGVHFDATDGHRSGPGHRLTFLRMPGVNRQGQAHIVSTASRLRICFSIDPQPASISATINISIVFICLSLVDHGRNRLPSGNQKRF